MLINEFIYTLSSLSVVVSLYAHQVNGSNKMNNQCAKYNNTCNPHQLQACCDINLSCKMKNRENSFVCKEKAKLKSVCISNEDCREITYAECSADYECICRVNNTRIDDSYCAPSLGALCRKGEKCATDHAVCNDSLCQCKISYEKSNDQCLPMIIGSPCQDDEVCKKIEFSKCSRRKFCVCSFNTIAINRTSCSPLLPLLGVPCQATYHCKVNNSICVDSRCQCKSAYLPRSNNECELTVRLDMPCENDSFCQTYIDHSTCSQNKKCVCDPNKYIFKNDKCAVAFSKWCQNDDTCLTDNAVCIDNLCRCKTNYIYDRFKCIPIYLNGTCHEQSDCYAIPFAKCSENNKCICNHEYVLINKSTCAPLLGAFCTRNVQCQLTSLICLHNKCQYDTNSSTPSNKISGSVVLGGPCQNDTECAISNSKCSFDGKCVCSANTFALNKLTCASTLFGYCHSDDQCYPVLFRCFNNMCQCKQNYTAVSAHQCAERHLLYSCDKTLDCSDPWHSNCSNDGKCVCRSNNIAINNSTCLPTLGGRCWRDDQCMAKNSICIDYQCVCMTDFIAVAGNLCISID